MTDTVYTVDEIAAMLRLGRKTVYKLCNSGKLKCGRFGPLIRITQQQLDEFMKSSEQRSEKHGN